MKTRTIVTLVIAGILAALVMLVAVGVTLLGTARADKYALEEVWSTSFGNTQSMQIIDLTGDGQGNVFLQNDSEVQILDAQGSLLYQGSFTPPLATTMGDVDADGVEDVAIFEAGSPPRLTFLSRGAVRWQTALEAFSDPSRAAVVRFADGTQVVVGDTSGRLGGFSAQGDLLWEDNLSGFDYIRGLDDIQVNGQVQLAAANHDGSLAVYDSQGSRRWTASLGGILRRMRAYDLDGDGMGEMVTGGENNILRIFDADTGSLEEEYPTGQTITEIRAGELDGNPSAQELVVGGKDGGVWALNAGADKLWSAVVGDKVTEIALLDVDRDGREEVIIGDDLGEVVLFSPQGDRYGIADRSAILRIDIGSLGAARQVAVADTTTVTVYGLTHSSLPGFRFTPLLVGLLISAVILVTAWVVATITPNPPKRVSFQGQSPESLLSNRRMLKESIADVNRLKSGGEMTPDAYLVRLKQLREELAENEAALKKAGVQIEVETFNCPHCGGKLQLGVDRCDYCGQVLLS